MATESASEDKRQFPWPMVIGLGIVVIAVVVVGFWSSRPERQPTLLPLTFGAEEQAYAARIEFTDIQMGRAANFLGQEVTVVAGKVQNRGPRRIRQIEVAVEFRNFQDQVVLTEKRRLFEAGVTPLGGGFSREFQVNFENVPAEWNQQFPKIRTTGLSLD
jgi:hypothetical protein